MDHWIYSHLPDAPTIRNWIKDNSNIDIRLINKWIVENRLLSTLLLAVVVLVIGSLILSKKRRKLPPGPIGLPFVGYLPFMTKSPHEKFEQLRKKYGSIFRVPLGNRNVVVFGTFEAMKEALTKQAFYGRPKESPFIKDFSRTSEIFSGPLWKEQRKLLLQFVRNFGNEKTRVEENIAKEIFHFVEKLQESKEESLKFSSYLGPSISNITCTLLFGKRYPYDDKERMGLDNNLKKMADAFSKIFILFFFPTIRRILTLFGWRYMKISKEATESINEFMVEKIESHKGELQDDLKKDYLDTFLTEVKKNEANPDSTFKEDVLVNMGTAFFFGGSETTRSTLEWAFLTMAAFPEVQKRVRTEIDEVIGKERHPLWTDIPHMPYTQAVIMEVMRWKSITPLSASCTLEDTEVGGYFIPKDTLCFGNLWAVHRSPDNFLLPEVFRPERFLSEDGKQIIKPEAFVPFGIGKRACPGEPLGKAQVFMYFTSILQKMILKPAPGKKLDFTEKRALGLCPKNCDIILEPRE